MDPSLLEDSGKDVGLSRENSNEAAKDVSHAEDRGKAWALALQRTVG